MNKTVVFNKYKMVSGAINWYDDVYVDLVTTTQLKYQTIPDTLFGVSELIHHSTSFEKKIEGTNVTVTKNVHNSQKVKNDYFCNDINFENVSLSESVCGTVFYTQYNTLIAYVPTPYVIHTTGGDIAICYGKNPAFTLQRDFMNELFRDIRTAEENNLIKVEETEYGNTCLFLGIVEKNYNEGASHLIAKYGVEIRQDFDTLILKVPYEDYKNYLGI